MTTMTHSQTEKVLLNSTENVTKFIIGGKANFTVKSLKTNDHLIYKVTKAKDDPNKYFVSIDYHYDKFMCIGLLFSDDAKQKFTFRKAKKFSDDTKSVIVFDWIVTKFLNNKIGSNQVEFYHHGKCARCGRKLTTPHSIEIGIGPECLKRN